MLEDIEVKFDSNDLSIVETAPSEYAIWNMSKIHGIENINYRLPKIYILIAMLTVIYLVRIKQKIRSHA